MADLKALPATNFTVLEALILMVSPVFGFTPLRALRVATLKVPNPMSWTFLVFLTPALMPSITAFTARSASALLDPRVFWTATVSSTLFMCVLGLSWVVDNNDGRRASERPISVKRPRGVF